MRTVHKILGLIYNQASSHSEEQQLFITGVDDLHGTNEKIGVRETAIVSLQLYASVSSCFFTPTFLRRYYKLDPCGPISKNIHFRCGLAIEMCTLLVYNTGLLRGREERVRGRVREGNAILGWL